MPTQGRCEQVSQRLLARPVTCILAFAVDYLAIAVYIMALSGISLVLSLTPFREEFAGLWTSPLSGQLTAFLMLTLPVVLYFALLEGSRRGATLGKRMLGLR